MLVCCRSQYLCVRGSQCKQTTWWSFHLPPQRWDPPTSPLLVIPALVGSTWAATPAPGVCWDIYWTPKEQGRPHEWQSGSWQGQQSDRVLTWCRGKVKCCLGSGCRRWLCCRRMSPLPGDWAERLRNPKRSRRCHSAQHARATEEEAEELLKSHLYVFILRINLNWPILGLKLLKKPNTMGFLRDQQHTRPGLWSVESNSP